MSAFKIAWFVALIFYFFEYLARSAPAVMLPELETAFHTNAVGISGIIGSYYYTYAVMSLVAGATLDRFGARAPVAIGAATLALGCALLVIPIPAIGETGRLLQGAGSAFAFTGAVYLAVHGFSSRVLATVIGATQCVGMLGGSAGQLAVGPLIHSVMHWNSFWLLIAAVCACIAIGLLVLTPRDHDLRPAGSLLAPFKVVFANPQTYLCGLVAGLLFVPTTVGIMIWGVAFFQQDRGLAYGSAVGVTAMVPLGWAIGCPLLGWIADALGRRKITILIGAAVMLLCVVTVAICKPGAIDYAAMLGVGIGSGAAMITYTIIKEVNPDRVKGSATGVINFLTFSVTALIGPVFSHAMGSGLASTRDHLGHFRAASWFWAVDIALAAVITLALRETGRAAPASPAIPEK